MKPICLALIVVLASCAEPQIQHRDQVSYRRGSYNLEFYQRHLVSFRNSAAIHYAHAKQHDILLLSPFDDHTTVDASPDRDYVDFLIHQKARRSEPSMDLYGPATGRIAWDLYKAIDWTHIHHEQTYDILSDPRIPWDRKKEVTDRAVRYYLEKDRIARSPAPLDVTMRRAAVMMKPYFTRFRNYYPQSNNFFFAAHWWHPAVYEAQMIGGPQGQDQAVPVVDRLLINTVLPNRPLTMLLSREVMPRYSKLSPESANIFDNLHMLHGIAYDILAYDKWSDAQKRAELYRVIEAMSYQPGDEKLAAKFRLPHPNMDPRVYAPWMRGTDTEMGRIMMEMMNEMMPMMMPNLSAGTKARVMSQFKMKMKPGIQPGEIHGSLHDALMQVVPDMKMMPGSTEP
jgi:hypothetical protein